MTSPQRPIGSGFGAESTASEVLAGLDLGGRLAIVTGGYSGIGAETTKALASAGAKVLVPARRPDVAEKELGGLKNVSFDELDLASLDGVERFADRLLARGTKIDLLINNAGIMACPETRVEPGWEAQFATNHLGHFALTNRIFPLLAQGGGARVIAVSSRGHRRSPVRFDDLEFRRGYDKMAAYGQSKTANILFALELDRRGEGRHVRAFSLHPGAIVTPLLRHLERAEMIKNGWVDEQGTWLLRFKTTEQGAATQVWAATSPKLAGMGGVYCEDCDVARIAEPSDGTKGVEPYAIDPDAAARLWQISAELTKVDAFA
jgi:NAD(P)-dependent dehydrogenase (short-subunit alcohol dehydrogenase family)